MYRPLRYLAIIFIMMPAMVLGRQAPQAPSLPNPPAPAPVAEPCPQVKIAMVDPEGPRMIIARTEVQRYDAEKRKTFEKTYKVSSSDILNIENKYGRVHVNTWNKKEIQVKVDMIARAGSESKATDMLNRMKVEENREGKTISLKTVYEPARMSGSSSSEINYTIYMPEDNAITIKNTYGDVYLASLKGKADINLRYGNLKSDRLENNSNTLKLTYGSGSCSYINGGNLEVAYFDVNVGKANGLNGFTKYSNLVITDLDRELDMDMKYGSLRVSNVSNNIRNIKLASTYIPISLKFADNSAFNFDVNVQYGDFKVDKSNVNITSLEKDYTSAAYKGRFGTSSGKGAVTITSKYGDVRFIK